MLSSTRVERVSRHGDGFLVIAGTRRFEAPTTSSWPWRTISARACRRSRTNSTRGIVQIHSFDYRNPAQLRDGDVLVVGAGNSGAEIALEASRAHTTWMSGRDIGHVPFDIDGLAARLLLFRLVLRVAVSPHPDDRNTVRPRHAPEGAPRSAGRSCERSQETSTPPAFERVPRVAGVADGLPVLEDGRVLDVANVVWCTGFSSGILVARSPGLRRKRRSRARARHRASSHPGLYFVGLHFLYAFSSTMIHGVGRDAERIASHVASTREPRDGAAGSRVERRLIPLPLRFDRRRARLLSKHKG